MKCKDCEGYYNRCNTEVHTMGYDTNDCEKCSLFKPIKQRIVRSKCLADMLVWLGFEYKKTEEGYVFKRTFKFNMAWRDIHALRQHYRNQR